MDIHCPKCEAPFRVSLRESLQPYTMSMSITPEPGRMIAAKTVAGVMDALADLLIATGAELGHTTIVHIHDLKVDESGVVTITVNALPARPTTGDADDRT